MQIWILFVLLAQFIWSICSLIDKIVISKGYIKNPFVYIILNGAMNVLLIFILPFFNFEPLRFADFLIALLSASAITMAIILYYKAVQYEEISRISIMFNFIPVFTLLASFLLLGEILTKNHLTGFLFLVLGGIVISYKKAGKSFRISKAAYYMAASAVFVAIAYISAKHILRITGFWSAVLWFRLTSFVALLALFVPSVRKEFIRNFRVMKKNIKGLLGFKMVIDFSAFIISDFALLLGPVSLVSALSSSSAPVFVFALSSLVSVYFPYLVKEDISIKTILTKLFAIALIIIGIVFVNI